MRKSLAIAAFALLGTLALATDAFAHHEVSKWEKYCEDGGNGGCRDFAEIMDGVCFVRDLLPGRCNP